MPIAPDPRRRNEHSRRAILSATVALMSELGYEQTSIEGIARRAGVGKQTIYRWWPSKGAIALEALEENLATVVDFQDTGDLVEDLRHHMSGVTTMLASNHVGPLVQGLIAAAQSDPALSRAHLDKVIEPATRVWLERIAAAQASGEIRADADPQAIIDMLFGAMYLRMLLHTRPLETSQIDDALHIAFSGLHPSPVRPDRSQVDSSA
jgi:AcrR family transcriptional regulator